MNDERNHLEQKKSQVSEEENQETSVAEEVANQAIDPLNLGDAAIKIITSVLDNFDI